MEGLPMLISQDPCEVIGQTPAMQEVRRVIERVSQVLCPVLILGQTGTGKEFCARLIHTKGRSSGRPFISVDCGLSPKLIEDELFGTEGQATSDAFLTRGRLCELAEGGTLFLDEVFELPLGLQARIVRLMDERMVTPANPKEDPVRFEGRIIAASTRGLFSALHETKFRKDLFFRLNVVSLTLPPLRERKSDIPLLVEDILRRISDPYGEALETQSRWVLSAEALDSLLLYDWPGNVRELEDCIKRAVILSSRRVLGPSDLFPSLQALPFRAKDDTHMQPLQQLQEMERKAIMESLLAAGGDKPLAARMLGIGKTTLYRKLHKYQQTRRSFSATRQRRTGREQTDYKIH